MKEFKNTTISVKSEGVDVTINLPWDVKGTEFMDSVVNIMRLMTFPTSVIISSLQETLDSIKEDVQYANEELQNPSV